MADETHLTVHLPFGDYVRGQRIEDAAEVAAVLASHPGHVVKHAPVEAAPVATQEG